MRKKDHQLLVKEMKKESNSNEFVNSTSSYYQLNLKVPGCRVNRKKGKVGPVQTWHVYEGQPKEESTRGEVNF